MIKLIEKSPKDSSRSGLLQNLPIDLYDFLLRGFARLIAFWSRDGLITPATVKQS